MKDFDAVVFDMDGVIFDSERATYECWLELTGKYGITDLKTTYVKCIGCNQTRAKQILRNAYGEDFPCDEYIAEASRNYHAKYDGGRLPMKEGVFEILAFLKENGKKIALASSTSNKTVTAQLRDAHILDYFDEIVSGDMVEKSKPEPDIFLLACERLGILPERTYVIEDSYNGIRAAHTGGLRPLMVPDMLPPNEEMLELSETVLDNLLNVIVYLFEKYK